MLSLSITSGGNASIVFMTILVCFTLCVRIIEAPLIRHNISNTKDGISLSLIPKPNNCPMNDLFETEMQIGFNKVPSFSRFDMIVKSLSYHSALQILVKNGLLPSFL